MLELIKGANLFLRFLLELCALGALGYWGFKTGSATLTKVVLGVGAPLVAAVAVVWSTFLSPRVPIQLHWGWCWCFRGWYSPRPPRVCSPLGIEA
jgi:hypothetical protein